MRTAGSSLRTRIRYEKPESHLVGVRASFDPNGLSITQEGKLSMVYRPYPRIEFEGRHSGDLVVRNGAGDRRIEIAEDGVVGHRIKPLAPEALSLVGH